jgi:hypothetical protein
MTEHSASDATVPVEPVSLAASPRGQAAVRPENGIRADPFLTASRDAGRRGSGSPGGTQLFAAGEAIASGPRVLCRSPASAVPRSSTSSTCPTASPGDGEQLCEVSRGIPEPVPGAGRDHRCLQHRWTAGALNSPAVAAKRRSGRLIAVSDRDCEAHNACVAFSGRRRVHGSSESALSSATDERSPLMTGRQLIPVVDGFESSSGPSEAGRRGRTGNRTSRPVRGRLARPGGSARDGRRGRRAAKGRDAGWLPTPSVRSAVRPASRPDSGRFDPFDL